MQGQLDPGDDGKDDHTGDALRLPPPAAAVQEVLRGGRGNLKLPFAYKLHMLLEDMEKQQTLEVISWVNNGSAFIVHNPDKFARTLMTKYFRQSKFTSFVRQVSERQDGHPIESDGTID